MPTAFADLMQEASTQVQADLASATVTYTAAAGGAASAPFDVIFEKAYIEAFGGDVASARPVLWCQAAQLADGGLRGGRFAVTGTPNSDGTYEISEPKPLSDGLVKCALRKVA
ncbi:MAG TPA: hypothetical protein VEA40_07460 [Ramlibacter sp.]|nr:hypothetical protein [Ramlibacter sp.]